MDTTRFSTLAAARTGKRTVHVFVKVIANVEFNTTKQALPYRRVHMVDALEPNATQLPLYCWSQNQAFFAIVESMQLNQHYLLTSVDHVAGNGPQKLEWNATTQLAVVAAPPSTSTSPNSAPSTPTRTTTTTTTTPVSSPNATTITPSVSPIVKQQSPPPMMITITQAVSPSEVKDLPLLFEYNMATKQHYPCAEYERQYLRNRVLVLFAGQEQCFCKLRFRGAKKGKYLVDEEQKIANQIVAQGLTVNDKHYQFLCTSNSGMKEHSVWFTCLNVTEVCAKLGDFSEAIKSGGIGKLFSRIGLSLGNSIKTVQVLDTEYVELPDITTQDKQYDMTDGAAFCCESLAREMAPHLGIYDVDQVPSVYQIRFKGYKGCITVYPDNHKLIKLHQNGDTKKRLFLRKSMRKFESTYNYIDVLNWSKPIRGNLSRAFIQLIHSSYTDDAQAADFQEVVLGRLDKHMQNIHKSFKSLSHAFDLLGAKEQNSQENSVLFPSLATRNHQLLLAGFPLESPVMQKVLLEQAIHKLFSIIQESHFTIPIPDTKFFIGVPDECQMLKPGQVVIQYQDLNGEVHPIVGPVFVSKFPLYDKAEYRMMEAVYPPKELAHITNAIVFDSVSPRPCFEMFGGGDLDGDLYYVSTFRPMFQEQVYEPLNYKQIQTDHTKIVVPVDTNADLQPQLLNHFQKSSSMIGLIDYQLRRIAYYDGIEHPMYQKGVKMACLALDAPKTGAVIEMSDPLFHYKPKCTPEWMKVVKELTESDQPPHYFSVEILQTCIKRLAEHIKLPWAPLRDCILTSIVIKVLQEMIELITKYNACAPTMDETVKKHYIGPNQELFEQECKVAQDVLQDWNNYWKNRLVVLKKQPHSTPFHKQHLKRLLEQLYTPSIVLTQDDLFLLKIRSRFESNLPERDPKLFVRALAWLHVSIEHSPNFSHLFSVCWDYIAECHVQSSEQVYQHNLAAVCQQHSGQMPHILLTSVHRTLRDKLKLKK